MRTFAIALGLFVTVSCGWMADVFAFSGLNLPAAFSLLTMLSAALATSMFITEKEK